MRRSGGRSACGERAVPGGLEELYRAASDGTINDYGPMLSVHFVDPDGMASEVCWMRDPSSVDAHPPRRYRPEDEA